jgi:SPP1 family predicted phage head-tail adaptor
MRAGRLRHRVVVERATDGTDAYGDQVPTWVALATVWASVEPLSGREYVAAAHVQADVSTRIVLRGIPGVTLTPKDRIRYGSRLFDIKQIVDRDSENVELQLLTLERFG